jgi:hypothetical protein
MSSIKRKLESSLQYAQTANDDRGPSVEMMVNETRRVTIERASASAARYCADRGLDTHEKMRAFIRSCGIGRLVLREPGQDDDEDVA